MGGADFPDDASQSPVDPSPESDDPFRSRFQPPAEPPPDLSPIPFHFTGSASEYFRIWIVNLTLSIATLGVYSAWAKVRRLRYFYGHTSLGGSVFGYHASPVAILKGRLIAYGVVLVLAIVGQVAPLGVFLLYLPLIALMPLILLRGLRFRARNSSYRGIRFAFDGQTSAAYAAFLGRPLLVPFTLGLTYPLVVKRQREFVVGNSRCGRSMFRLSLPSESVYGIYFSAAAASLVLVGLPATMLARAQAGALANGGEPTPLSPALLYVLLPYLGVGVLTVAVRTAFENLAWNGTTIDGHRFASRLRIWRMLAFYATNLLAIAATLGLAVPWARVRLARYRAESLSLLPAGSIVVEASGTGDDQSAAGAELTEAMDFDVGI